VNGSEGRGNPYVIFGLVLAAVILLVLVVVLFPPGGGKDGNSGNGTEDTGPWKDLTKLKASISDITILNLDDAAGTSSLDDVVAPEETLYMLIGVESNLSSQDIVSIRDFLMKGGSVIVADDGTQANRLSDFLLGSAGGKVEFTGHNYLVDKLTYDPPETDPGWVHNVRFVRGYSRPMDGRVFDLIVDRPNGLVVSGPARTVVTTTKNLTIIDMNDNGEMDQTDGVFEPHVPYGPIAVQYSIGEKGGSITYFSSSGLFTDSMLQEGDNEDFIRVYLLSLLPEGGVVLMDDTFQLHGYSPHTAVIPR